MATKAHLDGNRRYHEKFDDVRIRIPKGMREELRKVAEEKGYSVNAYIKKLIKDDSGLDL